MNLKPSNISNQTNLTLSAVEVKHRSSIIGHQTNTKHRTSSIGHRILALFLTFMVLLPSITPCNNLWANSNGPNAPEAASFEPVDATDMVNLLTGDFTYVLPLMNVPSPEGGYPIALAYHAGIAMDQEASWTGLGWNLNPGAINRSVNGYPDDYLHSNIGEFYYDSGSKESVKNLAVSYSAYGGASIGVGFSWGTNRSLGGYVSIGVGLDLGAAGNLGVSASVGTNGSSMGVGYSHSSGLSLGLSTTSQGDTNFKGSFGTNDGGFRIGASTDGTYSAAFSSYSKGGNSYTGFSLGFNISSKGVGLSLSMSKTKQARGRSLSSSGGIGIGANNGFHNTISQSDYTRSEINNVIPLFVPTPIGFFGLSLGKRTIQYKSYISSTNIISGPLKFLDKVLRKKHFDSTVGGFVETITVHCFVEKDQYFHNGYHVEFFNSVEAAQEYIDIQNDFCNYEKSKYDKWGLSCGCSIVDEPDFPTPWEFDYEIYDDLYEIPLTDNKELSSSYDIEKNNPVFPAYDNFNVSAQGLSGSMSAKLTDAGSLRGRGITESQYRIAYHGSDLPVVTTGDSNSGGYIEIDNSFVNKPHFYFDNEISSYLSVAKPTFGSAELLTRTRSQLSIVHQVNKEDFNIELGHLKKSNYIEYFTNWDIITGKALSRGLLNTNSSGFDRLQSINNGIGAYKITSPDGKTYHYSLPVYNHEIITRTFGTTINSEKSENRGYKEKRQMTPYATHWLLTAVTGPDFVDNGDGVASDGDLGYWVNFEYGLWSDAYAWKAPYGKDYIIDESDPNLKTWIKGRKQQYFLDKIRTRTHTALFVKSERDDNRSYEWKYSAVKHYNASWFNNPYKEWFTIPEQKTLKLDKVILLKKEYDGFVSKESGGQNSGEVKIEFIGGLRGTSKNVFGSYNLKNNVLDISDNWDVITDNAIKIVDFSYASELNGLVKGAPNTGGSNNTRLTLESVSFNGKQGENVIPPYRFRYNEDPANFKFDIEDQNKFGYYRANQSLWSLNKITTPQGGAINVEYEGHNVKSLISQNSSLLSENNSFSDIDSFHNIGGIRTKRISTTDGINTYISNYKYGKNNDGIGWISYFPFLPGVQEEVPYSAELPVPKPMYEYVTHESLDANGEKTGSTVYKFHVLNQKSNDKIKFGDLYELNINRDDKASIPYWNGGSKNASIAEYEIKDNLSCIGQLLAVSSFNSKDQLISKLENNYFTPEELTGKMGVNEESYQSYKQIDVDYASTTKARFRYRYVNNSNRTKYPSILKSSTELKDGIKYTTSFSDFDLVSGQAKRTHSFSSKGLELKTESIPAFYKYPEMGSKVDNIANKNMLSQGAQAFSYFKNKNSDDWYLYGIDVNTWSDYDYEIVKHRLEYTGEDTGHPDYKPIYDKIPYDFNTKVWRKHKTYVWKGELNSNGSYNMTDFVPFKWNSNIQDQGWQKLSEITKYSDYSKPLETMDINGNKASNKLFNDQTKVLATCNAPYGDMFYSGAEENYGYDSAGVFIEEGSGGPIGVIKHTGGISYSTLGGKKSFTVAKVQNAGNYKVSVWVANRSFDLERYKDTLLEYTTPNGIKQHTYNPGEIVFAGDWVQLNFYTYLDSTYSNIGIKNNSPSNTSVSHDDFRLHPIESTMTSYVYNKWDELECILGSNNMGIKYEYDPAGRLIKTYTEVAKNGTTDGGFKQVSLNSYNYKNQ